MVTETRKYVQTMTIFLGARSAIQPTNRRPMMLDQRISTFAVVQISFNCFVLVKPWSSNTNFI